jgi:hypothetical protein
MSSQSKTCVWTSLLWPGTDICTVSRLGRGWLLEGAVVAVFKKKPLRLEYRIVCDAGWRTRTVAVDQIFDSRKRHVSLRVDSKLRWWQGTRDLVHLRGCQDVDLMLTPATNMLPVRRLSLKSGKHGESTAAWILSPTLDIRPLPQRYIRLSKNRYLYLSATGFSAELAIDDFGMVKSYPGIWERAGKT